MVVVAAVLLVVAERRPLALAGGSLRLPLEQVALARHVRHAAVEGQRRRRGQPAAGRLWEAGHVAAGGAVVGVHQPEPGAGHDLVGGQFGFDLGDVVGRQELEVVGHGRVRGQRSAGRAVEGADEVVVGEVLADEQQVRGVLERELVLGHIRQAGPEQIADRGALEQVQRATLVGGIGCRAVGRRAARLLQRAHGFAAGAQLLDPPARRRGDDQRFATDLGDLGVLAGTDHRQHVLDDPGQLYRPAGQEFSGRAVDRVQPARGAFGGLRGEFGEANFA